MEPSHTKKYTEREIELQAAELLNHHYGSDLTIPVEIDLIAEKHKLIDDIVPAELLEDRFNTAAILVSKSNGCCDILIDEDTLTYQKARASFSIAHELGHVVLHPGLYDGCCTVEDAIALSQRIKRIYARIEREANCFAGAVLIPRRTIFRDTEAVYAKVVQTYGYDIDAVHARICSLLSHHYGVSTKAMSIRLSDIGLSTKIKISLNDQSPYLTE